MAVASDGVNWPLVLAVAVAVPELISWAAALLQRARIGSPLPLELQGIYDEAEYETSMRYTRAKSTYSLWKSLFDLVVFFGFWFLGGFPWLDARCVGFQLGGDIITGLAFMGLLGLGSYILSLPWDIYFTFVLEESFGFNKTTPATFVKDRVKAVLLAVFIGGPVLAVVLLFLTKFGTSAWLWVFFFLTFFQLVLVFLMPAVILPLFMEMIPLPEGTALITGEEGTDGGKLPKFLAGRAFFCYEASQGGEICDGKQCWATNDRRFQGSKGSSLSIAWEPERSEWTLAEGLPGSRKTVYAVASGHSPDALLAGASGRWTLSEDARAAVSEAEKGGDAGASQALVESKATADAMQVLCIDAGSLRKKLLSLAGRLGYHGAAIFVIDGSARSSHSNAFCTGFGSFRRICLFDTLLPTMSEGEILAVLGHEIGHDRLYHVHTRLAIGIAYSFLMLYALGNFLASPELSHAFFAPKPKVYLSIVFFNVAWGAIDFVTSFLMSAQSRADEFAADRYSVEADESYGKLLGDALKKLMKKSKVNLTPHPFYVFLTYSHPPLDQRLAAIRTHHKVKYGTDI